MRSRSRDARSPGRPDTQGGVAAAGTAVSGRRDRGSLRLVSADPPPGLATQRQADPVLQRAVPLPASRAGAPVGSEARSILSARCSASRTGPFSSRAWQPREDLTEGPEGAP